MKRFAILLLIPLMGCAAMRRHPAVTGAVVGIAVAVPVGLKMRADKNCPSMYDGHVYQGTPWSQYPCPQYAAHK